MIHGVVNSHREAVISITAYDAHSKVNRFDAVVDTGFDGSLSLPPTLFAHLGLVWDHIGSAILADGSQITFNVYRGTVAWDGTDVNLFVDEADSPPLVGMELIEGFELTIQAVDGGAVTIARL